MRACIAYVLHSGEMFGTERMALATLHALRERVGTQDIDATIIAPPGPVHGAAKVANLRSRVAANRFALVLALWAHLRQSPQSALLMTAVWHSVVGHCLQTLCAGRGMHLHIVHGGTDEARSYGRKRWLARLPIRLIAISNFVRDRLLAHGVPAEQITVIGNFLPTPSINTREPFERPGIRRVVMISRLDPIKRVGLLFDALDCCPALANLEFEIFGSGELESTLRARALAYPNVQLHGFVAIAKEALLRADLLLHTCPEEPFGLVLLEAFAAGVPVLVPNSGGAAEIVYDGINGWHFSANDARSLAQRLTILMDMPANKLNAIVHSGRGSLSTRHDPTALAGSYARLLGLRNRTINRTRIPVAYEA